ncbi:MAG: DUF2085 domain-containing protein [Anaerolineales bacterium]
MLTVTLYMREGCHLCDQAVQDLEALQDQIPHRLVLVDVEKEELRDLLEKIPVIEVGPYTIKAPFDKKKLQMTLGAARDRLEQLDKVALDSQKKKIKRGKKLTAADRLFYWLSRRYMLVFNSLAFIYVGLAFLAPILLANGNTLTSNVIYTIYGRLCHQLSYRSWFLFGEQPAYPRANANVQGLDTYEQATGLDPQDLEAAIEFRGNETVGYKVAFCQRDIAIYGAILLFGLIFALTKRKIPPLPIVGWIVLGMLPVGLDGVSQIISQLPWGILPVRESTPLLRTITGALFGFSTAWFGYPVVEQAMAETRKVLAVKLKAVQSDETSV